MWSICSESGERQHCDSGFNTAVNEMNGKLGEGKQWTMVYSTQALSCCCTGLIFVLMSWKLRFSLDAGPKHIWTGVLWRNWIGLNRTYDQGLGAKEKTDRNVCLQEKRKRKKTCFSSNSACGGWRDDSVGKSYCYSCKGLLFSSQNTLGTFQPSLTEDPEDQRSLLISMGTSCL